jgi:hypothetical protein
MIILTLEIEKRFQKVDSSADAEPGKTTNDGAAGQADGRGKRADTCPRFERTDEGKISCPTTDCIVWTF